MIKKFGFKNFSSFNEGAEISFEFDGNTPSSISNGSSIGSVIGVKGSNGSGKTNILKALSFLFCFISRRMSTTKKNSSGDEVVELPLHSFFFNEKPSEFYIELLLSQDTFYYELDVLTSGVVSESIYKNDKLLVSRNKFSVDNFDTEYEELQHIKLKEDRSVISIFDDYNLFSDFKELQILDSFFKNFIFNVGSSGLQTDDPNDTMQYRAEFYNLNPDALKFVKSIIKGSDDGIRDIQISSYKNDSGEDIYYPLFVHEHLGKMKSLIFSNESMGTRTLFNNLYKYWRTLKAGGVLVFDEFDIHLHAMILPEILGLFTNPAINLRNAQLIITAHNTEVIDDLGRYRTVLVNKEGNESYCYRLDRVAMLRNDRPISPFYKKGKIGGVPKSATGISESLVKMAEIDGEEELQ